SRYRLGLAPAPRPVAMGGSGLSFVHPQSRSCRPGSAQFTGYVNSPVSGIVEAVRIGCNDGRMSAKPDSKLQLFYIVGLVEAISCLLLFFVAMPLKYILAYPDATRIPGWLHGILFIAYVGLGFYLTLHHRWQWKWFAAILIGA